MTTRVIFLAFTKATEQVYSCSRVSSKDVDCVSDVLQIAKDEYFSKSNTDKLVVKYNLEGEQYRCVIDRI